MNRDEFMASILEPLRKQTAVRVQEQIKVRLHRLTIAPIDEELPIAVGCFGNKYELIFGTNEDVHIHPRLTEKYDRLTSAEISNIVGEAARQFAENNHDSTPLMTAVSGPDVSLIVESMFYLYRRDRGAYSPRPDHNLRIANLQFTDIHSNDRSMFLAYWTRRRLPV